MNRVDSDLDLDINVVLSKLNSILVPVDRPLFCVLNTKKGIYKPSIKILDFLLSFDDFDFSECLGPRHETALCTAVRLNHVEIVEKLINHKNMTSDVVNRACTYMGNVDCKTALQFAYENKFDEIVKILKDSGKTKP